MKEYNLIHKQAFGKNVRDVQFNRDDSLIAVASEEIYIGTIDGDAIYKGKPKEDYKKYYWNLGKNVPQISFMGLRWSPDNKRLWCAAGDFYVFDIETQKFKRIYQTAGTLECIDINDSKQLIALSGQSHNEPNKTYLFNYDGELLLTIESKHGRRTISLAFTSDGTKLVTGGHDQYVRIWDTESGQLLDEMKVDDIIQNIYAFKNPDQFIVEQRYDSSLYTIDSNGKMSVVKSLTNEFFPDKSKGMVGYSRARNIVASLTYWYSSLRLNTGEGEPIGEIEAKGQIKLVAMGNVKDIIAVAHRYDNPLEIHFYSSQARADFLSEDMVLDWEVERAYPDIRDCWFVAPIQKDPGKWIGVGTYIIGIYDSEFKPIFTTQKSSNQIYLADFSKAAQKLVYFKLDETLHVIDLNQLDLQALDEKRFEAHMQNTGKMFEVRWSHKGDQIAFVNNNKELIIYDAKLSEVARYTFKNRVFHLAWSKDDDIIAVSSEHGLVYYYNVANQTVKELNIIGIDRVEGITCDIDTDEFIITGIRFVNILNHEGFLVRKLDLDKDIVFYLPTCRPNSSIFAMYGYARDGYLIYIVDRDKPIRQCVTQIIRYHTDLIQYLNWEDKDTLISEGNKIGLVFWKEM